MRHLKSIWQLLVATSAEFWTLHRGSLALEVVIDKDFGSINYY